MLIPIIAAVGGYLIWDSQRTFAEGGEVRGVFHGSDSDFENFDINQSKKWDKFGIWFTEDKSFAELLGEKIKKADITLRNPKVISYSKWNAIREKHAKDDKWFSDWKKQLLAEGYDGLEIKGSTEKFGNTTVTNPATYAVFSSEQIKNVTNVV